MKNYEEDLAMLRGSTKKPLNSSQHKSVSNALQGRYDRIISDQKKVVRALEEMARKEKPLSEH